MEWAIVMAAKIANQTVRMAKRVREADGLSAGEEMPILRCDRPSLRILLQEEV